MSAEKNDTGGENKEESDANVETTQYADDEFTDEGEHCASYNTVADAPTRRQLKRWAQSRRKHNLITSHSNDGLKCKRGTMINEPMVNRRLLYLPSDQQRITNGHRLKGSIHRRRAIKPPNGCREWFLAIAMVTLPVILMLVG